MSIELQGGISSFEALPQIPFYEGLSRVDVAEKDAANFDGLVHRLRWITPKFALAFGDKVGEVCLQRTSSPFHDEIKAFKSILGVGVYTLNTGYEWACTAMAREDEAGLPVLNRVLDWALPMGQFIHVAKYDTAAGPYYDINWAGNSGIINAVAPGRFTISINQAPIPMHSGLGMIGFPIDWIWQRVKTFSSSGWLPSHLLRHVFEEAKDFDEAVKILSGSKLAIPVIFTICGSQPGQRCMIERTENDAHILTEASACTANHWQKSGWFGHPRPVRSRDRLAAAQGNCAVSVSDRAAWGWLKPPILNSHSIMAFIANTDGLFEVVNFRKDHGKIVPLSRFSL